MKTKTTETIYYSIQEVKENSELLEKVLERNRFMHVDFDDWHDFIIEDFKEKIEAAGFNISIIYYSGFWSQGDGAMFEYSSISQDLLKEFTDTLDLSPMRKGWILNNVYASAKGTQRGHYYHENSCSHEIYWEIDNGDLNWDRPLYKWLESFADQFETFLVDKYIDFCGDIYHALEKEYDYLTSDEFIIQSFEDNDTHFLENGEAEY